MGVAELPRVLPHSCAPKRKAEVAPGHRQVRPVWSPPVLLPDRQDNSQQSVAEHHRVLSRYLTYDWGKARSVFERFMTAKTSGCSLETFQPYGGYGDIQGNSKNIRLLVCHSGQSLISVLLTTQNISFTEIYPVLLQVCQYSAMRLLDVNSFKIDPESADYDYDPHWFSNTATCAIPKYAILSHR